MSNTLNDKFDSSKVSPFSIHQSTSASASLKTLYQISRKGLLSSAYLGGTADGANYLRITIDGVIKHYTSGYGRTAHGIFNGSQIFFSPTDYGYLCRLADNTRPVLPHDVFPSISGVAKSIILTEPIFFKNSLIVEGSSYDNILFVVTGGLY